MTPVVAIDRLGKRYGRKWVVQDVSIDIQRGDVFGLLGPNGSGKTTILRSLTGYLQPTTGRVAICGHDVMAQSLEARRKVGYVPEDVPLYAAMRVTEFLRFMAGLRGLRGQQAKAAVAHVINQLALASHRDIPLGKLSRGFKQRVMIAQALLGEPELLLLDVQGRELHALDPTGGIGVRQIFG